MKKTVMLFLMVLLAGMASAQSLYSIQLEYDSGNVSMQSISFVDGETTPEEGNFTARSVAFNGTVLYSTGFNFEPGINYAYREDMEIPEPGLDIETDFVSVLIPYNRVAESIEVLGPEGEKLVEADISEYAECNLNNACEQGEDTLNCPEDCLKTGGEDGDGEESTGFIQAIIQTLSGLIEWMVFW